MFSILRSYPVKFFVKKNAHPICKFMGCTKSLYILAFYFLMRYKHVFYVIIVFFKSSFMKLQFFKYNCFYVILILKKIVFPCNHSFIICRDIKLNYAFTKSGQNFFLMDAIDQSSEFSEIYSVFIIYFVTFCNVGTIDDYIVFMCHRLKGNYYRVSQGNYYITVINYNYITKLYLKYYNYIKNYV